MKRAGLIAVGIALALGALTRAAAPAVSGHLTWIIIGLAAGVPALLIVAFAMIKGAEKHTVQAWHGDYHMLQMPPPAERQAIAAAPAGDDVPGAPSAFETLPAPEEEPCEGPGCTEILGGEVFEVAVTFDNDPDREEEIHRFCSDACAQEWHENDIAHRATGAVR